MPLKFTGEHVTCNLCNSCNHEAISNRGRNRELMNTVICRECGLVFTNPMPTQSEIDDFYSWSYRISYKGVYTPKPKHIYRNGKRAIPRLLRVKELGYLSGALLDVGSGGGEFLYLMSRLGYEVHGVEPDLRYGEFTHKQYDLDVILEPVQNVKLRSEAYDIITMNHVLEHIRNPVEILQRIRLFLRPKGVLIVEVPNVSAVYHSPKTKFHFAHLYNFSMQTLERLGARVGLKAISAKIIPYVCHINMAFIRDDVQLSADKVTDAKHYEQIHYMLGRHDLTRHMLSGYPYRRFFSNLARPIYEKIALRGETSPRVILDRIYTTIRK